MVTGLAYIDGIDIGIAFNLFIEMGSADFLKFPPKKDSIERDWKDANGREVDLSRIFFDQREGVLDMAFIVESKDEFFQKQAAFLSLLTQPGLRRLSFTSHGDRSYFVYYRECNNYKSVLALGKEDTGKFAYRFSLVIVEPEPTIDASDVFLVDEEGHFIIT